MFATSKNMFKAELTAKLLLEIVVILIIYSQIYPNLIEPYLQTQIDNSDPVTAALLNLIPFLIAAMIIIGIISYHTLGQRRR